MGTGRGAERVLGVAYLVAALASLTMTLFFGLLVAPVLLVCVGWLAAVGSRLLVGGPSAVLQARRTAPFAVSVGLLMVAYGLYALRAAARSAGEGGGLLGGFGVIAIVVGVTLVAVSALTLALTRPAAKSEPI